MGRRRFIGVFHHRWRDAAQALLRFFQRARQAIDFHFLVCHGIAQFLQGLFLKGEACFQFDESVCEVVMIDHRVSDVGTMWEC